MNFNLENCYHQLLVKGKITILLQIPDSIIEARCSGGCLDPSFIRFLYCIRFISNPC
jgi:hypothetical protein